MYIQNVRISLPFKREEWFLDWVVGHTSEVNKFIEQKLMPYIVSHELKIQGSAKDIGQVW